MHRQAGQPLLKTHTCKLEGKGPTSGGPHLRCFLMPDLAARLLCATLSRNPTRFVILCCSFFEGCTSLLWEASVPPSCTVFK